MSKLHNIIPDIKQLCLFLQRKIQHFVVLRQNLGGFNQTFVKKKNYPVCCVREKTKRSTYFTDNHYDPCNSLIKLYQNLNQAKKFFQQLYFDHWITQKSTQTSNSLYCVICWILILLLSVIVLVIIKMLWAPVLCSCLHCCYAVPQHLDVEFASPKPNLAIVTQGVKPNIN